MAMILTCSRARTSFSTATTGASTPKNYAGAAAGEAGRTRSRVHVHLSAGVWIPNRPARLIRTVVSDDNPKHARVKSTAEFTNVSPSVSLRADESNGTSNGNGNAEPSDDDAAGDQNADT